MTDPMLEAARAHTKEPEEVDWEAKYNQLQIVLSDTFEHEGMLSALLQDKNDEVKRLKDVILRLEQRCAKLQSGHKIVPPDPVDGIVFDSHGRVISSENLKYVQILPTKDINCKVVDGQTKVIIWGCIDDG